MNSITTDIALEGIVLVGYAVTLGLAFFQRSWRRLLVVAIATVAVGLVRMFMELAMLRIIDTSQIDYLGIDPLSPLNYRGVYLIGLVAIPGTIALLVLFGRCLRNGLLNNVSMVHRIGSRLLGTRLEPLVRFLAAR